HLPLLERARGGSLLTGLGGDQLFELPQRTPRRMRPRDLASRALAGAPRRARAAVIARRSPITYPWLRAAARRAATRAMAAEAAATPRAPLGARMGFELGARYLRDARASLAVCAAAEDVLLAHPLCAPQLWSAVAHAAAARGGFASHERALQALFSGWLPDALAARTRKASFDAAFWHRHSRAFAAGWDGDGVPRALVDVDALREHWRSPSPACPSLTLMQAAWLAHDSPGSPRPSVRLTGANRR
ncbi:MAG TPA: hypothetical protein VG474_01925, partial [Solirubrobacteraceae bacterium]|nr:hypothetical protein [Solirubrobacteraceae bacterium]